MPQSLHSRALTEEVPDRPITLYLEQFDGDRRLPPLALVDDAVASLGYLLVEHQLGEVDLAVDVEAPRLHTDLIQDVLFVGLDKGLFLRYRFLQGF